MPISRTRATAGAIALMACTQYFIAEAVAAAAWHDPAYDYARNFISDLGMPGCLAALGGRVICSPLASVMNAGFVIEGVLVILALLLLLPLLVGTGWRIAVVGLALIHAAGTMMVGIWHESEVAGSGASLHVAGAMMAILGGNGAIAVAGLAARRAGAPGWFATASVGLGLFGLCGAVALVSTRILPPGIFERAAVDGISVWKIATGVILAAALPQGRLPSSRADPRVSERS